MWYVTSSPAIKMRSPGNCLSVALFSSQVYWSCDLFDKLNDWQLQYRRQNKAHVNSSRTVVWVISCPISLKFSCLVKLASASEKVGNTVIVLTRPSKKIIVRVGRFTTSDNSSQCPFRRLKKDVKMYSVNISKKYVFNNQPPGIFLSSWQTDRKNRHTKIPSSLLKAGVNVNRSGIWSIIKRELFGLKWVGNTTRQLTTPNESPRLVGDYLVTVY